MTGGSPLGVDDPVQVVGPEAVDVRDGLLVHRGEVRRQQVRVRPEGCDVVAGVAEADVGRLVGQPEPTNEVRRRPHLLDAVNTLALSVFDRTRELGLLRAVGMTRGQVRAMVRWESVVISLIGALSGAALGIGIGLALSQALKDEGIKAISIPGPQIAVTSCWPRWPECWPPSVRPGRPRRSTYSRRW